MVALRSYWGGRGVLVGWVLVDMGVVERLKG